MISTLYLFLVFWCFKFDVERLIGVFRFRMKVPFNHDFCYYRFIIGLCCCWDGCFRVKDVCVGVISYQDVIYLILMWVFFFCASYISYIFISPVKSTQFQIQIPFLWFYVFWSIKLHIYDLLFETDEGRFERMRSFLSCAWTEILETNLFDKHLVHLEES